MSEVLLADRRRPRGLCNPSNAHMFEVLSVASRGVRLSQDNWAAVELCNQPCPIKARCRVEADDLPPEDRALLIRGGEVFDARGNPVLHVPFVKAASSKTPRTISTRPLVVRVCVVCGQRFESVSPQRLYCTTRCRKLKSRERQREPHPESQP